MKTHSSLRFLSHLIVLMSVATMLLSVSSDVAAEKGEEKGVLLSESSNVAAEEDEEKGSRKLTSVELQSKLMSFSDRFATIMDESFLKFAALNPTQKARLQVRTATIYSALAALTIAAAPNPDIALLDLIILTKLGRMVYEDHWRKVFGNQVDEIIIGFKILEKDILQIANTVLTEEQLTALDTLILKWRKDHPKIHSFTYIRFDNLSGSRYHADLVKNLNSNFSKTIIIPHNMDDIWFFSKLFFQSL